MFSVLRISGSSRTSYLQEIPRQQYEVVIKATCGDSTKPIVQSKIAAMKKDFTELLKGNFGGRLEKLKS